MLTYNELFMDYEGNEDLFDTLLEMGYPFGYFLARLNWADPWKPGTQTETGQWLDAYGHLWKDHNPPVGAGMIDDGYVNYDNDPEDDTVGYFQNLQNFTLAYISPGHLIKIFKIS